MSRTFLRMIHRVDIYKKVVTADSTGQHLATWQLVIKEQKCYATPTGATSVVRMAPTIEGIDYFTISFPWDAPINYDLRLENLISGAHKEKLYNKPLQVIKLARYPSYTGKVNFVEITAKTAIEV